MPYRDEADFEAAVLQVQSDLFGPDRVYLDIKKRIGVRGVQENVPDGYILDLSGTQPRLYVVENELSEHDPLRHIAVQLLQFSLSFEAERRRVRTVLFDAIQQQADIKTKCEKYVGERGFRNLEVVSRLMWKIENAASGCLRLVESSLSAPEANV